MELSHGVQYRFFTIHGHRRAFLSAGTGPPLLLIHGIGDSSRTWLPVVEAFARDHTVIAPDLLGHGLSDKPRADYSVAAYANGMRDLLSVLDVDRVTVVGHSLGGGVAAQFAYTFPERCERLVLVGTGGIDRSVSPLLRLAALPNADLVMPTFGSPVVKVAARIGAHLLRVLGTDLGRDTEEILRVFDALPDAAARRAIVRTLRSGVDWRGQVITMLDRAYLAEGMPTLLVWGGRDAIIPVAHAHVAAEAMPGSRLEIFEDAGHFPHHSDPERFVAVVRDFLRDSTPPPFEPDVWRARLRRGQPVQAVERTGNADGVFSGSVRSGT
ncbi:MAG: alpha/beta hydrolase [Acidimicrobiales bacterium]